MVARTMLVALDNNCNVGRPMAVSKTEENTNRYTLVYPKSRKAWVARPVYEQKSFTYATDMLHDMMKGSSDDSEDFEIQIPLLPRNIAKTPRPNKVEMIAEHISRFK